MRTTAPRTALPPTAAEAAVALPCGPDPGQRLGPGIFALLLLLLLGTPARGGAEPAEPRPPVMLMSGLPLVWGEKGPFDPSSRPAAAYVELSKRVDFRGVDLLDPATLGRGRLLILAQPQRLAPAELVALDGWIRGGGRALILNDPRLNWPSDLPLADIRRPPPVGLLEPLLMHWGLTIEAPAEAKEVETEWDGRRVAADSPGRLRSAGSLCTVEAEGLAALCRLGRGQVRVVADADLLHDSRWDRNSDAVTAWVDELAGRTPARPRRRMTRIGASAAAGLMLVIVGAGLILLRRRRRHA